MRKFILRRGKFAILCSVALRHSCIRPLWSKRLADVSGIRKHYMSVLEYSGILVLPDMWRYCWTLVLLWFMKVSAHLQCNAVTKEHHSTVDTPQSLNHTSDDERAFVSLVISAALVNKKANCLKPREGRTVCWRLQYPNYDSNSNPRTQTQGCVCYLNHGLAELVAVVRSPVGRVDQDLQRGRQIGGVLELRVLSRDLRTFQLSTQGKITESLSPLLQPIKLRNELACS